MSVGFLQDCMEQTLRWLLTKLAEWIGENLQDELGFPDKADRLSVPLQQSSIISC
jgi:hypothetical protein